MFPDDAPLVRRLFEDYQRDIGVDLCFQSFREELDTLPGRYLCVLLHQQGCVALRPFAPGVIELKRLFVYPDARGSGLGRRLVELAIDWARREGYQRIHLDTLKSRMPSAVRLYEALGFVEIPAGGGKSLPDLIDMELDLAPAASEKYSSKQTRGTQQIG